MPNSRGFEQRFAQVPTHQTKSRLWQIQIPQFSFFFFQLFRSCSTRCTPLSVSLDSPYDVIKFSLRLPAPHLASRSSSITSVSFFHVTQVCAVAFEIRHLGSCHRRSVKRKRTRRRSCCGQSAAQLQNHWQFSICQSTVKCCSSRDKREFVQIQDERSLRAEHF